MFYRRLTVLDVSQEGQALMHRPLPPQAGLPADQPLPVVDKGRLPPRPKGCAVGQHHQVHSSIQPLLELQKSRDLVGRDHIVSVQPQKVVTYPLLEGEIPCGREVINPWKLQYPAVLGRNFPGGVG